MSTLSKKTKGQLVEIAEDLNIDISDCKVKKDVYDAVRDYFIENADIFDENSKYYELALLSKFGSPKKTVFIESEDGDVKEVDIIEESVADDEETEEEVPSDISKEEDEDDDDDEDEDFDLENYTNFVKAIKHGNLSEYLELKNYEVRDFLGDPYTLNELTFYIETFVLLVSLSEFTSLDSYLPSSVLEYIPSSISQLPVLSHENFSVAKLSTLSLWYLTAKTLPLIVSYYINFTYDFDRDAFTEALAKLFLAVIIFKTDVGIPSIKDEVKYAFSLGDISRETVRHFIFVAILNLRDIFGNWILLDAVFTSILSLYANLAFV
jgi:hypothetical protein